MAQKIPLQGGRWGGSAGKTFPIGFLFFFPEIFRKLKYLKKKY